MRTINRHRIKLLALPLMAVAVMVALLAFGQSATPALAHGASLSPSPQKVDAGGCAIYTGQVFADFPSQTSVIQASTNAPDSTATPNPANGVGDYAFTLEVCTSTTTPAGSYLVTADPIADAHSGPGFATLNVNEPLTDEQINIHVNNLGTGQKQEGTCWRISYGPAKVPHDVVGDDTAGVKPDCGEPSNLKLFDEDPAPGVLLITITAAQRGQFGDIWHVQNSFSPVGKPDPNNYECDLSQGKCTIPKTAVGGLSVDLAGDETGLPLETAQSSGTSAGLLAGVIAAISAVAITVTGAAWYARRRWVR